MVIHTHTHTRHRGAQPFRADHDQGKPQGVGGVLPRPGWRSWLRLAALGQAGPGPELPKLSDLPEVSELREL